MVSTNSSVCAENKIAVRVIAGGEESSGWVIARTWSPEEQKKRALKGLGVMWGLAIASIFLPLVHFLLVPGFLISGPIVYFWLKKQTGRIIGITAGCPRCRFKVSVNEANLVWPLRMTCKSCFEPLRIELASD